MTAARTKAARTSPERAAARPRAASLPTVGFASLGCPKALVDSERILTQLRAEGYLISPTYDDADLVVVNTCGFMDSAIDELLGAISEAVAANGRVIVTGCLEAKGDIVRKTHPRVLAVTGPHATEEVMRAVRRHLPQPHDPYLSLIPPQGVKLTPPHYAYLKIAEGCNHRCTFLPGPVPEAVKQERRRRFMKLQENISARRLKRKIGKTITVLVDEVKAKGAVARSSADAPEIDRRVHIAPAPALKPGEFASVRVTRAGTHDLWADPHFPPPRCQGDRLGRGCESN